MVGLRKKKAILEPHEATATHLVAIKDGVMKGSGYKFSYSGKAYKITKRIDNRFFIIDEKNMEHSFHIVPGEDQHSYKEWFILSRRNVK
jgi:hypothetical protein